MLKKVDPFAYAAQICTALKKGVLLTTAAQGKVNTMTIGWGALGIEWNKPVFIAYVRQSRYTRQLLEQNPAFTVNIPTTPGQGKILSYCGTRSGADTDKIQDLGLTLVTHPDFSVPGIAEFPLTLNCRVMYRRLQKAETLEPASRAAFYPPLPATGKEDLHIAFYGEIVDAYLIEP